LGRHVTQKLRGSGQVNKKIVSDRDGK